MIFLIPGKTCWRVERADRLAVLVDTEACFNALARVLPTARRRILILGWGLRLRRDKVANCAARGSGSRPRQQRRGG